MRAEEAASYGVRVELRVHDESTFLPVDLPKVFLTRTARVRARRVDLASRTCHTRHHP